MPQGNTTHPVYVDTDDRVQIKMLANKSNLSMKDLMQRSWKHAKYFGLHRAPEDVDPFDWLAQNGIHLMIEPGAAVYEHNESPSADYETPEIDPDLLEKAHEVDPEDLERLQQS